MLYFLLACSGPQKDISPQTISDIAATIPIEKQALTGKTTSPKIPLKEIVVSHSLPSNFKRTWPLEDWSYAKAYTFNFVPYGPGNNSFVYRDGTWNEKIEHTVDITKDEADNALELIHHTAGDIESSGCIFPRHGIVYFNEADEPIASINYCFSCEGILLWPHYLDQKDKLALYELSIPPKAPDEYAQSMVIEIYFELEENWRNLFLERLALPNPSFQ